MIETDQVIMFVSTSMIIGLIESIVENKKEIPPKSNIFNIVMIVINVILFIIAMVRWLS